MIGLATIGLAAASLTTLGCTSRGGVLGVDRCADIPAGAIPEPAGSKVCNWQSAQVTGAVADQTVLYHADFVGTSAELSPGAIERMARNANSGLAGIQPSFVEPSGSNELDAARVNAVTVQLASFGIPSPVVEVASPAALGLRGPQAERVASGFGTIRNSSSGTGAPISQPSGLGGQSNGFSGGIF
ncbi:putative signal peptide protein [Rhodopirellula islandica]|uniref:Signal peptide protein n=2 Tax=Rhodopirellula islandica TaxID=595434 RepID=A0A0J1BHR4_RHOIS|nr:putative signal peptide protein [Rhodopirellula islandica]